MWFTAQQHGRYGRRRLKRITNVKEQVLQSIHSGHGNYHPWISSLAMKERVYKTPLTDEEESNDEENNSKFDSSTEIDPDLEEGDTAENKCFTCRYTKTFGKKVILKETTGTSYLFSDDLWKKTIGVGVIVSSEV
ncbi:hypothetical protein TNCV_2683651 [Trichonephila clavipes]|nr:hypothetical protein TNCV_2683651 [Trichonephila clavipes]